MSANSKDLYEFGPFRLDVRERLLTRDGAAVPLTPKAFETLLALIENAGHVLEKDDLLKRVWPDTFVEESTLAKNIFTLRKTLGDDQDGAQFIETVPKVGYRFVSAVRRAVPKEAATASVRPEIKPAARTLRNWAIAGVAFLGILTLSAGYYFKMRAKRAADPSPAIARLAVLPLENLSGDAAQSFLSDGLTEEIITQMAELDPERLGVIARNSAMQYRNTTKSASQIGSELGVDYLLEGSVRRDGNHIRVTAQLIRARDQSHLWAASYDRDLRDVLALQTEIARAVASQVGSRLTPEDEAHSASGRSVDPEAYDLYLKARHFWNRRTADSISKAIALLQQAIVRDANYARAHAALADCYVIQHIYASAPARDALRLAEREASRALELDPFLGEAYATRAYAEVFDWNFASAETDFRKSFRLSPHYATAHQWYGEFLRTMGRQQEAIEESKRALEIDPLSSIINDEAAMPYYYLGDYDRAIAQLKRTTELDPFFATAHGHLAAVYYGKGMYSEALQEGLEAKRLADAPWIEGMLGIIETRLGHTEEAQRILATLKNGQLDSSEAVGLLASVHAAIGEKEQALAELEQAYREHSSEMVWLKVDPLLASIHSEPRYQDLLRRIGFPP